VRWGTAVGSIVGAALHDGKGAKRDVFHDSEMIEVRVRFRVPDEADRARSGVAFSIKDLSGSDLVVYTSLDEKPPVGLPEEGDLLELRCSFDNCLASGDYYLTVALEDRHEGPIRYFDYIEGAEYFSTAYQRVIHGRFVPVLRNASIETVVEPRESM
jgi:lipopolysaccharide transport system ATP-binding protein